LRPWSNQSFLGREVLAQEEHGQLLASAPVARSLKELQHPVVQPVVKCLLASLRVTLIVAAGAPTNAAGLARALGAEWRGGYVGVELSKLLSLQRPFAAEIHSGGRLSHMVVVDVVEAGQILIRDPAAGGTTYRMLL
jgi:hypothetical protein